MYVSFHKITRYCLNLPGANSIYELRSPVFRPLLSAWYPLPIGSPGCYLIPRFLCLSCLNHIIKHWQFIILEINAQKNVLPIMLDICSLTKTYLTILQPAFLTCWKDIHIQEQSLVYFLIVHFLHVQNTRWHYCRTTRNVYFSGHLCQRRFILIYVLCLCCIRDTLKYQVERS